MGVWQEGFSARQGNPLLMTDTQWALNYTSSVLSHLLCRVFVTECMQYPYTHTNAKVDTVSFSGHSLSIHPIALHMHTKCCSAHQQWEHL